MKKELLEYVVLLMKSIGESDDRVLEVIPVTQWDAALQVYFSVETSEQANYMANQIHRKNPDIRNKAMKFLAIKSAYTVDIPARYQYGVSETNEHARIMVDTVCGRFNAHYSEYGLYVEVYYNWVYTHTDREKGMCNNYDIQLLYYNRNITEEKALSYWIDFYTTEVKK